MSGLTRADVIAMAQLILSPIQTYIVLPESKIICKWDSALAHLIDHDAEQRKVIEEQAQLIQELRNR